VKRVYIVSPLRPRAGFGLAENIAWAHALCLIAAREGVSPFAPQGFYTMFLSEMVAAERQIGMDCGQSWLRVADEVWVYDGLGISTGMHAELGIATALGIPVVLRDDWRKLPRSRNT
jgi:hypothetical protein